MIANVITILGNPSSRKAADRCVKSAKKFGIHVSQFAATTPDMERSIEGIANEKGIPTEGFKEVYSRYERCLAAFISHYTLWENCVRSKSPMIILEHDAVFVNEIPPFFVGSIVNLGKPSYGNFRHPTTIGEGPLISKDYLPGAHAYYIDPKGAKLLIEKAKTEAGPTDIFINKSRFNINEYLPWPVEAKDTFTTIQNRNGCIAKHNYDERYEIL